MEHTKKLEELMKEFPKEATQKVSKNVSKKGYDTTGLGYQYIINRMNTIFGLNGWGFEVVEKDIIKGRTKGQYPKDVYECDMEIKVWVDNPENHRPSYGGHISFTRWDAKKGALTSALKKGCAYFSCGWQAYAAVLDDDSVFDSNEYELYRSMDNKTTADIKRALVKIKTKEQLQELAQKNFKKDLSSLDKSELVELYNEVK